MADKYINQVGVQAIRTWADGKFALDSDLDTLSGRVDEIVSEGGEPNAIQTISVNGTNVAPDAQKNVALSVPTKTSDLTNDGDGTSNFATENYVATNSGKIDKIKVNGTKQPIDSADKSVNIAVPITSFGGEDGTKSVTIKKSNNEQEFATISISTLPLAQFRSTKTAAITIQATSSQFDEIILPVLGYTNISDFTNDSGYQTASDVSSAISQAVASAYIYKGSVATVDALPTSDNTVGDVYDVQSTGVNYAWTGTAWDALGSYVDTSVLWTSAVGQSNTLEAMTVAEVNAILNAE